MLSYYKRVARVALRDPRKLHSMMAIKMAKVDSWDAYANAPTRKVAPPLVVAIRMNYSCDLRCVMCNQWGEEGVFIKTPERMVKRTMTTDDWIRVIDELAELPVKPFLYFTGGEPLMNKDIMQIVRHASSRHLITSMSTNSSFLKERSQELIESGLDYLYTSLDAPEPEYHANSIIRKTAKGVDSNSKSVQAIRHMIELRDKLGVGLPIVQTQTIVVKENQHQLLDMAKFVDRSLRSDMWGLQLCVYTTPELDQQTTREYQEHWGQDQVGWTGFVRGFPGMNFDVINAQLDEIMKTRWSFKLRAYRPLGMRGFDLERYFTRPDVNATDEKVTCMNPYVFAQLQPNGDLAFCGSQPDYTIGSVKTERFMDLWRNEGAQRWRQFLDRQLFSSCKRCFSLYEFSHFKNMDN